MPPIKRVDFLQAGKRHFNDAELLRNHARDAAAGQLYGFAAECGIKSLLAWSGYPIDPVSGEIVEPKKKFRKHIHELVKNINMLHTYLNGKGGAKYLAMIPSINDFSDWNTDHRYYTDSALPPSLAKWRKASREIMIMLDQVMLDKGTS
jgi:hypothetical protein